MSIDPRILALKSEVSSWRRDFHAHPEILYEVHRTAKIVADKLRAFGCDEVVEGIGQTGVVGVIHGRTGAGGRVVGLRADMDALPIEEETNLPHRSTVPGKMHACGHDGHTSMLLGAAKHLAATREFEGTVIVIFQPAEEGGAGGKAMVEDGLMTRWKIEEVYGMHNMPGMPPGKIALRPGPIMAAADRFIIDIEGRGAHAAAPHLGVDPVLVGAHIVTALQSIASRNADPLKSVVVSATMFHAGSAFNIIPQRAQLTGTVRTLEPGMRDLAEQRLRDIVAGVCRTFGAEAAVDYERGYPATINHPEETRYAADIARQALGEEFVDEQVAPMMGGEDFSFMLIERPGAYVFIGNGDSAGLHHPAYDFNDDVLPYGMQFWTELAKARTAA
ncbi:M20 aminoacylase family protein [Rhabdaerophilum sp. SD176]|uniref:M20 aminoacylase family protein n=1 Tax=Rhabdaerophilum sp. SD176 TaxID=2983548 RepID=UPI0024E00522|nr:M20 aminoacylase family protein [Rhabdaerophilum sp. SD176]